MSSAHRPTWTPAMGKDARMNTKQFSSRDIAAHTKLKYRQPGQNNKNDIERRDLRRELELAERESESKRRRLAGLLPIKENEGKDENEIKKEIKLIQEGEETTSSSRRRKILEDALIADKDDSDSDDDNNNNSNDEIKKSNRNGKLKAVNNKDENHHEKTNGQNNNLNIDQDSENEKADQDDDDNDDDDDDSDDDESETAELLRELEKIKRERAEEKERQEREAAANSAIDKEVQAAAGNPLLNLKAALNQTGNTSPTNSISASTNTTSFSVKRRWDDDVIFKNQARDVNEKPKKEFVNDLLRTEFHRRFLKKFIA